MFTRSFFTVHVKNDFIRFPHMHVLQEGLSASLEYRITQNVWRGESLAKSLYSCTYMEGKIFDGRSPNLPMLSPTNALRYTVHVQLVN